MTEGKMTVQSIVETVDSKRSYIEELIEDLSSLENGSSGYDLIQDKINEESVYLNKLMKAEVDFVRTPIVLKDEGDRTIDF